jgi:hypothetical protein
MVPNELDNSSAQGLLENLPAAARAEALEMGDVLRRASGAVLENGESAIVSEVIKEFIGRVDNADGAMAANAILEALYRAREQAGTEQEVTEDRRIALEIAVVEAALNTQRLLASYEENSR